MHRRTKLVSGRNGRYGRKIAVRFSPPVIESISIGEGIKVPIWESEVMGYKDIPSEGIYTVTYG